ncbi:MAG: hypothetical protein N3E48_00945, partial [Candidatus Bathyarchaeota archaeon]|nr:hypothetical protein [Candidatus Bathyarchaeota archaeon]
FLVTELKIVIPENLTKLEKQIKALEYLIQQDTNPKDKEIEKKADVVIRTDNLLEVAKLILNL